MEGKEKASKASSLLSQWKQKKKESTPAVTISPRLSEAPDLPSKGQERLWLLQQLYPDNPFYQYAHLYHIEGDLDISALHKAYKLVKDRHEVLRSAFIQSSPTAIEVVQMTLRDEDFQVLDWTNSAENLQEKLKTTAESEGRRPFDLSKGGLFRLTIIKVSDRSFKMIISMHHIIGDRWSLQVLQRDLFTLYHNEYHHSESSLPQLSISYFDYAHWQRSNPPSEESRKYWLEKLAGDLPQLRLPFDRDRSATPSYDGEIARLHLDPEMTAALRLLAQSERATMFVLMLTIFKVLLHRYSGQDDILIGCPFNNRDHKELESLIGFFNETVVLRTTMSPEDVFIELMDQVKTTNLEALKHKNYPFEELVKALNVERHGSANPIFQVMFLYNEAAQDTMPDTQLRISGDMVDLGVSKFDLTLFVDADADALELKCEYAAELFDKATIDRFLSNFQTLAEAIVQDPRSSISQYPIVNAIDTKWLSTNIGQASTQGNIDTSYPSVVQWIARHGDASPDTIAITSESASVSYDTLINKARKIAHALHAIGVKSGDIIGVAMNRSTDFVIAIQGILMSGAAYLPIDLSYPLDRIRFMISDAEVGCIICDDAGVDKCALAQVHKMDFDAVISKEADNRCNLPAISPTDLAYVIYTSGSTGNPKGVPIHHDNLMSSTLARLDYYSMEPECFLLLSSFSFDSSVAGLFWTLCTGGNLVIAPTRIEQDIQKLVDLMQRCRVTHTLMLPTLYQAILTSADTDALRDLRCVMVAGEACPLDLIQLHHSLLPHCELHNEYGPTEATVWCIAHKLSVNDTKYVPIGRPIPQAQVLVVNQNLQLCPIGVAGELCIGGPGVAKGYINNASYTTTKFIDNPYGDGKIYRTGDLVRIHADGLIEFLGRIDNQVKIRGYRVEPASVESRIRELSEVEEAIVTVYTGRNNTKSLIAYVTGVSNSKKDALSIKLQNLLPAYMLPSKIICLEGFERLPNGKVDRKKLPAPGDFAIDTQNDFVGPTSSLEQIITDIWQDIIGVAPIGIHDNFFSLGGDSILSIQVVSRARDAGIHLSPTQIFEYQTIRSLADSVKSGSSIDSAIHDVSATDNVPLSSYSLTDIQRAFLWNHQAGHSDIGLLHLEFTLSGPIDHQELLSAWRTVEQMHDVLRARITQDDQGSNQQAIADDHTSAWHYHDHTSRDAQDTSSLKDVKSKRRLQVIDLYHGPSNIVDLIRIDPHKHILLWTCHHIFLDGWSCGLIIKDMLEVYNERRHVAHKPQARYRPNFLSYLHWKENQDPSASLKFWATYLEDYLPSHKGGHVTAGVQRDHTFRLTTQQAEGLKKIARKHRVSLSTILQGIWSLICSRLSGNNDVVFGVTVSGRFAPYPNIENLAGLLMNVVPTRILLDNKTSVSDWLQAIQQSDGRVRPHEDMTLDEIRSQLDIPATIPLFETLFVYGNFLKDGLAVGDTEVVDFEGGFSSTYPLTIRVNPATDIEIDLRYDDSYVTSAQIADVEAAFIHTVVDLLHLQENHTVGSLLMTDHMQLLTPPDLTSTLEHEERAYHAPSTDMERLIVTIWQKVFGIHRISVSDDFFDLGGKSLLALKIFAEIDDALGSPYPPSLLFSHPTVSALSAAIVDYDPIALAADTSCLIPLKQAGDKPPLFCIHGGGAHVFFYQPLSDRLADDRSVYSFQPPGLADGEEMPRSIAEMAKLYITLMKKVQPSGPYHLLGTCFSNAVVVEISHHLNQSGDSIGSLFIIDSSPVHLFGNDDTDKSKTVSRFFDMLKRGDISRIRRKIKGRLFPKNNKRLDETVAEMGTSNRLQATIENLNKIYASYHWRQVETPITFIRSSEFANRKDKNYHLYQWNKLTNANLVTHIVEGHHLTLFEAPEVDGLAKQIQICLDNHSI